MGAVGREGKNIIILPAEPIQLYSNALQFFLQPKAAAPTALNRPTGIILKGFKGNAKPSG